MKSWWSCLARTFTIHFGVISGHILDKLAVLSNRLCLLEMLWSHMLNCTDCMKSMSVYIMFNLISEFDRKWFKRGNVDGMMPYLDVYLMNLMILWHTITPISIYFYIYIYKYTYTPVSSGTYPPFLKVCFFFQTPPVQTSWRTFDVRLCPQVTFDEFYKMMTTPAPPMSARVLGWMDFSVLDGEGWGFLGKDLMFFFFFQGAIFEQE